MSEIQAMSCPRRQYAHGICGTRGLIQSYGIFQTYYQSISLSSETNISWIGSLQGALLLCCCLFTGYLYDAGYVRQMLYLGHALIVGGMMLVGICSSYWHFLLTQGMMVGLGSGLLFLPCVSILQQYFSKRRNIATGIASTGSSIGMFHVPGKVG